MNILIVSNFFYPNNRIGSFRINAFAKYFSEAGHSVTVVTEGDRDEAVIWNGCKVHYIKDYVLPESESKSLRSQNTGFNFKRSLQSLQFRLTLDFKLLWRFRALRQIMALNKNKSFDVILSTYDFLSPHMIALRLRRKIPGIYWIADMRDEMSKSPFLSPDTARRIRPYERKILDAADLVLSVSAPLVEDFKMLGGHGRVLEIKNGYDYEEVHSVSFQQVFTMAFIGKFYSFINPENWFKAFSELISAGDIPPESRINIIGNHKTLSIPENIRPNITLIAEVGHSEAIKMSLAADTLVLVHPKGRKGVYTGKLFDYLATNKPILAICDPNDVIAELLAETNAGFTADVTDVEDIKSKILQCYSLWKNKQVLPRKWDKIRQYTRRNQVGILLEYLSRQDKLK